nr:MAG TPA: Rifin [Caudoviricetes sp.]
MVLRYRRKEEKHEKENYSYVINWSYCIVHYSM